MNSSYLLGNTSVSLVQKYRVRVRKFGFQSFQVDITVFLRLCLQKSAFIKDDISLEHLDISGFTTPIWSAVNARPFRKKET